MTQTVKVDQRAFNRGVDDVLTLRPVRQAVGMAVNALKNGARQETRSATPRKGSMSIVRRSGSRTKK